ncbi:lipid kinase YegS [Luteimonas sp. RD2P54]|uniref:Probable lipid kinase YegS-like n=1 Tax=Luteimonas endophytica TaxID=3042023 RepID=A0ABT6J869_9GAMM|nr:lipid kinase YegS [Luteimonas endophytica]MDH5823019.1 lipid kinase YegS [Luteimonas endophytica]
MPPTWRLILNGKSAGDERVREAVHALRSRGVTLDVRVTWEQGDAARHVDEALADGVDALVAGGGDGTLSEIVAALAGRDESPDALPALALLPLGTANDFAVAADIPPDPMEALELALAEPARPIDLLRVEAGGAVRWCANLASGGFGTSITVETNEGLKKMLGGLAYLLTGIARMGRIEPLQARIRGPGFAWEGGFIALGVGNGRQAGGGQALCPDALVDDGQLDLTVVPELEGEVAATLGRVISEGRAAALEQVAVRARLPWVEVEAREPIYLNLDGEPVEADRFRIECVPGRVRMHLPAGSPLLSGGPASATASPERAEDST